MVAAVGRQRARNQGELARGQGCPDTAAAVCEGEREDPNETKHEQRPDEATAIIASSFGNAATFVTSPSKHDAKLI